MKYDDLVTLFSDLRGLIKKGTKPIITEMVFFKCYVNFEVFICELFSDYATGVKNERNYIPPTRELQFRDKDTLDNFLTINRAYTEYYKLAEDKADLFFSPNPFSILKDAAYGPYLYEMKLIRNYIAHNSIESKGKYEKNVIKGSYIEPGKFLVSKIKGTSTQHIDNYLNCMLEVAEKALVK